MIPVAIIDDHSLFRYALATQIEAGGMFCITQQANNGKQFIDEINIELPPSIVFLDIIMPEMNGFDTAFWISSNYPDTRIIAMSMLSDSTSVTRMLKNGVRAFIGKDAESEELQKALAVVLNNKLYINLCVYKNLLSAINRKTGATAGEDQKAASLTVREKEFLQLLCTGKGYKEIASIMYVSPRTIDGYRDALFQKIGVSTKVDLVTFAIRNHFVKA